jgi:peptidoglycan/LPS O-acetylase OafA/YrhL
MASKNTEIRALTGMRGIASLCVAIVHGGFDHWRWISIAMFPDAAVDLFFCMSGFSLCLAYRASEVTNLDFWRYLRARVARIYPLYVVSTFLMWWLVFRHLAGSSFYPMHLCIRDLILQIPLMNTWPVVGGGAAWDMPAWSISVEALCYVAVFPSLFKAMPKIVLWSVARRLELLVILGFTSVIAFIRSWDAYMVSVHAYQPSWVALWIPSIRGIAMFLSGGIIYSFWYKRSPVALLAGEGCNAVALAALGVLAGAAILEIHKDFLALLAPALVLGLAVNPTGSGSTDACGATLLLAGSDFLFTLSAACAGQLRTSSSLASPGTLANFGFRYNNSFDTCNLYRLLPLLRNAAARLDQGWQKPTADQPEGILNSASY